MAKKDHAAIKAIKEQVAGITLEALAKRLSTPEYRVNKGYLSSVLRGQRPASNRLRLALGLHPLHVTVAPLPCGHAPCGKRCAICQPAQKYAAHPVMRVSRLRKLLQNQYLQS